MQIQADSALSRSQLAQRGCEAYYRLVLHAQSDTERNRSCLSTAAGSLESVLINRYAFRSEILIGPYADATQVDWTLQRTMTQPVKALDTAAFNAPLDDCLSKGGDEGSAPEKPDPKTPKNPKPAGSDNTETHLRRQASLVNPSFLLSSSSGDDAQDDSTSSATKKKKTQPGGDDSSGQKPKGQEAPTDSSTRTRGCRINFGSGRFIVSAGLTGSPLALREFGKGVGQAFDVSGKPTANIITLKTDQSYRLSPMVLLNTRVYQWSGAGLKLCTPLLGFSAKSDLNGVAPEYLIGLSQSFVQCHLLLTAGAYAGRRQRLTGGLFVNEAIPSNLTGVFRQSNYAVSVGFSIWWRIPGLAK